MWAQQACNYLDDEVQQTPEWMYPGYHTYQFGSDSDEELWAD